MFIFSPLSIYRKAIFILLEWFQLKQLSQIFFLNPGESIGEKIVNAKTFLGSREQNKQKEIECKRLTSSTIWRKRQ